MTELTNGMGKRGQAAEACVHSGPSCKTSLCHAAGGHGSSPRLAASSAGGDDDQMEEAVDAMIRFYGPGRSAL